MEMSSSSSSVVVKRGRPLRKKVVKEVDWLSELSSGKLWSLNGEGEGELLKCIGDGGVYVEEKVEEKAIKKGDVESGKAIKKREEKAKKKAEAEAAKAKKNAEAEAAKARKKEEAEAAKAKKKAEAEAAKATKKAEAEAAKATKKEKVVKEKKDKVVKEKKEKVPKEKKEKVVKEKKEKVVKEKKEKVVKEKKEKVPKEKKDKVVKEKKDKVVSPAEKVEMASIDCELEEEEVDESPITEGVCMGVSPIEEVEVHVKRFEHNGVKWLRDGEGVIYDMESQEEVGVWKEDKQEIEMYE